MTEYTTPDPSAAALLTIDMQVDFATADGAATIPGTEAVTPAVARLVAEFRDRGRPIVHVVRLYRSDGSNVDLCRRAGIESGDQVVEPGSEGAELVAPLTSTNQRLDGETLLMGAFQTLGPQEWGMYKPRWSAFYGTSLEDHLRDRGISTVVVAGCNFPNCPRTTIYDASARDFRIVVVPDAISGIYDRGLEELANIGCVPMTTDAVLEWLT